MVWTFTSSLPITLFIVPLPIFSGSTNSFKWVNLTCNDLDIPWWGPQGGFRSTLKRDCLWLQSSSSRRRMTLYDYMLIIGGLNKVMVCNCYMLPLILELIDRVQIGHVFTKIDLRRAYNLLRIKINDKWKTIWPFWIQGNAIWPDQCSNGCSTHDEWYNFRSI